MTLYKKCSSHEDNNIISESAAENSNNQQLYNPSIKSLDKVKPYHQTAAECHILNAERNGSQVC